MEIVNVKISAITPYENNPRKNKASVDKVAASIKEFGFKQPIVVDSDGVIIAGHTRYQASIKLGLLEVPVVYATDLTPDQVKAYRLADNKVADFSEWNEELLTVELADLKEVNFDMVPFGFEPEKEIIADDDFEIELPEVATSKRGEIYKLGDHRLMVGDSTVKAEVDKLMDGKLAHMVFTDPPWNVDYGAVEKGNQQGYKPRTIMNDKMTTSNFAEFLLNALTCQKEHSVAGCMTYIVMSAQEWGSIMQVLAELEYHWSSTIIWAKDQLVLSRKDYHTQYEPIWYGWKAGDARNHPLTDRKQSDLWEIPRPKRSDEHPTMKPLELVSRAILNSSDEGNIVLDLFGGSGTTLIASEETKRTCYMMELDPKYADVIIQRYEEFTGQEAVKL